jgi:hypothetical protein
VAAVHNVSLTIAAQPGTKTLLTILMGWLILLALSKHDGYPPN